MQPASFSLDIYRGDSGHWQFKLWNVDGTPTDLTGVVAKSQIRDRPGGTQIITLTCSITLPNIIDVMLTAAESAQFHTNGITKGAWDLQLTYPSGDILTVVGGTVTVTPDVTDSTQPFVQPVK